MDMIFKNKCRQKIIRQQIYGKRRRIGKVCGFFNVPYEILDPESGGSVP
jgi:hypothetical protein